MGHGGRIYKGLREGSMNHKILKLFVCVLSLLAVACSNQYREADAEVTAAEMLAMLDEVQGTQAQSFSGSGSLNEALALKDEAAVRIYFAESSGIKSPLGPVASVLSLTSFDFLGVSDLWWGLIEETRIFFMDLPTDTGRRNSLILGIRKAGETAMTYAGYTGTGDMSEADMIVTLQAGGVDKLMLQTFDVEEDDLTDVIQMLVWDFDASGSSRYIGKFSTLVGYGD